jgi:hypothetical protein
LRRTTVAVLVMALAISVPMRSASADGASACPGTGSVIDGPTPDVDSAPGTTRFVETLVDRTRSTEETATARAQPCRVLALAIHIPTGVVGPLPLIVVVHGRDGDPAMLLVQGDVDVGYHNSIKAYPRLAPPKWFVTLHGSLHSAPFEIPRGDEAPIIDATTTAFWNTYLKGVTRDAAAIVSGVRDSDGRASVVYDIAPVPLQARSRFPAPARSRSPAQARSRPPVQARSRPPA